MLKSWKTGLIGLGGAVLTLIANGGLQTPEGKFDWKTLIVSVGLGALGIFAKDHDVTGGVR
jgi:hypothetical protein